MAQNFKNPTVDEEDGFTDIPVLSENVGASLPDPEAARAQADTSKLSDRHQDGFCCSNKRSMTSMLMYALATIAVTLAVSFIAHAAVQSNQANSHAEQPSLQNEQGATLLETIHYLAEHQVSSSEDLKDATTSQHRAALWMARSDKLDMPLPTSDYQHYEFVTRYLLALMYFEFHGEDWMDTFNFLSAQHACLWSTPLPVKGDRPDVAVEPAGAYCDDAMQITSLHLGTYSMLIDVFTIRVEMVYLTPFCSIVDNNSMLGNFPSEIALLTTLEKIEMNVNVIRGTIPDEFCGMSSLRTFSLAHNELVGNLPDCIGTMSGLESLVVSDNLMHGELPNLSGMTALKSFALANNMFEGDVTTAFNQLTSLRDLYIENNQDFIGRIDDNFLDGLEKLRRVDLSGNSFTGVFPEHLVYLESLEVLDLHANKLEGSLPSYTPANPALKVSTDMQS